jgi:site-specific DNA recombinase
MIQSLPSGSRQSVSNHLTTDTSSTPIITPEKVARVGGLLRDKLYEGPPEFRQAYARLLMDEVRVTDEEIRISGPKSVLARCAAEGAAEPVPKVLSFVQEWRARQDSNLWPLPSEGRRPI